MSFFERLRERFWFIPALLCVGAFGLAEGLIAVDRYLSDLELPAWGAALVYRVGESGSRDVLGAIASSSLAVAGTTFSITIAVLALTSSSYGPRLVRNFMADRGNQAVLGVFVSTFLYSLLVLRSIRVIGDPGGSGVEAFVPHLAVNAAVLLAVVDVAVLIYFIHHISDSIQVSTLAGTVRSELVRAVDRLYPDQVGQATARDGDDADLALARATSRGVEVTAGQCGYVQAVRDDALMTAARQHDVLVVLRVRPGQYVLEDTVVLVVDPPSRFDDDLADALRSAVQVGDARSPQQDPEFSVEQLTEMAVRALSPGINDPYTAINALDDLSVGLARLAARPVPSPVRRDGEGAFRVYAPAVAVDDLIGEVVDSMRWYATSAPSVMLATLTLLERVGGRASAVDLRAGLVRQVDRLERAFVATAPDEYDRARFVDRAVVVRRTLSSGVTGRT